MRESRVYLRFLLDNCLILFSPAVILAALVGYVTWNQPAVIHKNELLSMDYNQNNVQSQIQLADQAVSLLREQAVQQQLGIRNVEVVVYKPGPLLVSIDVSSKNDAVLDAALNSLSILAQKRFPFHQEGVITRNIEGSSFWADVSLSFITGIAFGFILSLIKAYWKNY